MKPSDSAKAGWHVGEYTELTGVGRSKLYTLPPRLQPKSFHVGTRKIITEPPRDWLARLEEEQAKSTLDAKIASGEVRE